MDLQYGKRMIIESYSKGQQTKKECYYSIPTLVDEKTQALGEIIKAIDLIVSKKTHKVVLTLVADSSHKLKMLTTEYTTDDLTN